MDTNTAMALHSELQNILAADWKLSREGDTIVVTSPGSALPQKERIAALQSEAWRIAEFTAYSNFVSIAKTPDDGFEITSYQASGKGFTIRLRHGQSNTSPKVF